MNRSNAEIKSAKHIEEPDAGFLNLVGNTSLLIMEDDGTDMLQLQNSSIPSTELQ